MNIKRYEIRRPWRAALATTAAIVGASGLVACGGGGVGTSDAGVSQASPQEVASNAVAADSNGGTATALGKKSSPAKLVNQPANTEGRLLASNCFQCHGTLGTGGFDSIRGKDAREVLKFLNKPASSEIMAAHTQGYTPAQLQKIIAYLQQ